MGGCWVWKRLEEKLDDGNKKEKREGKPTVLQPIRSKGFIVFGKALACG